MYSEIVKRFPTANCLQLVEGLLVPRRSAAVSGLWVTWPNRDVSSPDRRGENPSSKRAVEGISFQARDTPRSNFPYKDMTVTAARGPASGQGCVPRVVSPGIRDRSNEILYYGTTVETAG